MRKYEEEGIDGGVVIAPPVDRVALARGLACPEEAVTRDVIWRDFPEEGNDMKSSDIGGRNYPPRYSCSAYSLHSGSMSQTRHGCWGKEKIDYTS